MRKKHHEEFDPNAAWGSVTPVPPTTEGVSYYRALFDFEARNEDELSFTAGDIIQVCTQNFSGFEMNVWEILWVENWIS